jgi:hypothetical protein
MDEGVTLWLEQIPQDQGIMTHRHADTDSDMHCLNTARRVSFAEFVATTTQFISMVPSLPIDDAERIYAVINRDYLNTTCTDSDEPRAASLLRCAADAVCIAGGHAPLFNSFE